MHQGRFKFEKTRTDSEQRRRSLYLKFSRFAEISVTGLTGHSFVILPSKNSHNFQTQFQFCSVSYLFLFILPSNIKCISVWFAVKKTQQVSSTTNTSFVRNAAILDRRRGSRKRAQRGGPGETLSCVPPLPGPLYSKKRAEWKRENRPVLRI